MSGAKADIKMAYATEGTADPYAGFETRIVPENVTLLPRPRNRSPAAIRQVNAFMS